MWGIGYIAHRADGVGGNDLRTLVQEVRAKVANTASVICVIGGTTDKPAVVIATTEGARQRGVKAGELVRTAAEALGGRGGGKDDLAQGGGTNAAGIDAAFTNVEYAIGAIATR
jgi:alanyl-tRNA synthetase